MGSRCLIAKVERDGRGRYILLNHMSSPDYAGRMLLEHYQDEDKLDRLLDHGSIGFIAPNPEEVEGHHVVDDHEWEYCRPTEFEGGTEQFFGAAHMLGPEWIYCWTPDGWAAAQVTGEGIPGNYHGNLRIMTPLQFEDWYDTNQEPLWVQWRQRCHEEQIPRSLSEVVQEYEESESRREAEQEIADGA